MKNLLLLIAVTFSLNIIAQVPTYVPTNGLLGWYSFTGNADDESGISPNGVVNGATLTSDRFGNVNEAYSFDGIDDLLEIAPGINLNTFSISLWFKTSGTEGGLFSMHRQGSLLSSYATSIFNGKPVLYYTGTDNAAHSAISTINTDDGIWHNFIGVYANNNLSLYIDGTLVTETATNVGVNQTTLTTLIGAWRNGANTAYTYFYTGDIDDIGVWTSALSLCQIQDLYGAQLNSVFVDAGIDQSICNGNPVTLTASNSMNYGWNNSVVDGTPFSPSATSSYIVTADSAGCTSIDSLTVIVNQPTASSINETATDTYTSPSGIVYDATGVYNDTISNTMNCDSVITINLTMEYTGINEYNSSLISLFPNPASNKITINGLNDLKDITKIEITSITGAIVRKENITNSVIDISMLNSGMYLLFISHENGFEKISFLKE